MRDRFSLTPRPYSRVALIALGALTVIVFTGEAAAPPADPATARAVRALVPLGALAIVAGTLATAAGPHAGGEGTHDVVKRVRWFGSATLERLVHYHGTVAMLFGVAAVGTWW